MINDPRKRCGNQIEKMLAQIRPPLRGFAIESHHQLLTKTGGNPADMPQMLACSEKKICKICHINVWKSYAPRC